MTQTDSKTIIAVSALSLVVVAILAGFGVEVPTGWITIPSLVTTIVIAGIRIYVGVVGAANTELDEGLAAVEALILEVQELIADLEAAKREETK